MIYLRENLMNNVLKVSNLTKTYPNFKLVDVSFEIKLDQLWVLLEGMVRGRPLR